MADFVRPPTRDEMQYAGDVVRGKRRLDAVIIVGAAVVGAAAGVALCLAGAAANEEPAELGSVAGGAFLCAAALAVIAALVLFSVRSIRAACEAWAPARVITAVAVVLLVARVARELRFAFLMDRGMLASRLALNAMFLVFAVLFLNLGIRLVFIVYCMVTGRDEEEIVTRNISADTPSDEKNARDEENARG